MQPSPWLTDPARAYAPLDSDRRVDVVVVGAGITGVTAAYLLRARGFSVALLDRGRVGGGDTGHTTAHLAAVTDRPPHDLLAAFGAEAASAVWDAGTAAIREIERIAGELGIDCGFARVPGYLHARPGHARAQADAATLREGLAAAAPLGLDAEWCDAVPVFDTPGIRYADQARFRPQVYLHAMAAALHDGGCLVCEHTNVDDIAGRPFRVSAAGHVIQADRVVLATHVPLQGAAGSVGTMLSQVRLALYTSYALRARIERGSLPDALWWDTVDPYRYVRIDPGDTHDYVIVGGADHKTGQRRDEAASYGELETVLRAVAPAAEIDYRWSGQVVEPSDGLPFIGESAAGQFSATGYGGNGLTFGTIAGLMAADWASGVTNPFSDVFAWGRSGLRGGGASAVLNENADYPLRRLHDAVTSAPAVSEASLALGGGAILEVDGTVAAVYRRQDGSVARLSAACPHMGCRVAWNDAEATWDCPCHGSRFAPDGAVLAGPAETPLVPLEEPRSGPSQPRTGAAE
ncbi:MAG: FAD-dependent oxidoreductase [Acidobacteria bacterium]|nr:FAD-dependent oxidoreductase [Acidobacteriota bacterium]